MQYVCSMYAVYMPNMCSKVADIYAVLYMHVFCIPHVLVCGIFQFIFVYAAHVKTSY